MAWSPLGGYILAVEGDRSQERPLLRSAEEVEALLASTEDLVGRVLGHLRSSGIRTDPDELRAFGHQGLVEAAQRFDPAEGEDFRRFAYFRVRGSMLDGLRKMGDWSRRGYERISLLRAAGAASEDGLADSEDTKRLSARDADERLKKHMASMVTAMSAGVFADHTLQKDGEVVALDRSSSAEELIADKQMCNLVRDAMAALPPPEDEVIARFYVGGERMETIAEDMGRSKSWVSRVHTRALKRLGARLRSPQA